MRKKIYITNTFKITDLTLLRKTVTEKVQKIANIQIKNRGDFNAQSRDLLPSVRGRQK